MWQPVLLHGVTDTRAEILFPLVPDFPLNDAGLLNTSFNFYFKMYFNKDGKKLFSDL